MNELNNSGYVSEKNNDVILELKCHRLQRQSVTISHSFVVHFRDSAESYVVRYKNDNEFDSRVGIR